MIYPGFVGPTYRAQSPSAGLERCVNLYPEILQGATVPKNKIVLYGTPGLRRWCTLPNGPCRGGFAQDGRAFIVAGGDFVELNADKTFTVRGQVANDGKMVTFSSNGVRGQQIFLVSAASGYIFDLNANGTGLSRVVAGAFPAQAAMGTFVEGYFIVLLLNDNEFQISKPEDGQTWNGVDFAKRQLGSDNFIALGPSQRGLWFFGSKSSEVWYNNGAANFPFAPVPGVFIEEGIAAPLSVATQFDNSLVWLGQNQAGGRVARRAEGYTPKRISNHGVEAAWALYSTVADAVGYTYKEQGHEFYVLTFPTAQATWAYDIATDMWHERMYLNPNTGMETAHRANCHVFAFDRHLVGDRESGNVYDQAIGFYDDDGAPIRSIRRAPFIGTGDNRFVFHQRLELEFDPGVGTEAGQGLNPQAMMQFSNNGKTWSNEYLAALGAMGAYGTRAYWQRLGRARWRSYQIAVTDPVRRAWINAYIDIGKGLH